MYQILIMLIIAAAPFCRTEMREHAVTINHDGMLNFPNPTELHNLDVGVFIDSSLMTNGEGTLNYNEIVNEFLVAHNFFDPTIRFTIVLRAEGTFDFRSLSGNSFTDLCVDLDRDREYASQVDFTIILTPHMPPTIMGWGVYAPACVVLQAAATKKPELLTFIHEVGHALRGLYHSDKPAFDCNQFTFPAQVETCRKLRENERIVHTMLPSLPEPTYTTTILGENILTPPNLVFVPGRSDSSTFLHVAPLDLDTADENNQRFLAEFSTSVNTRALHNFCAGPPVRGLTRCVPTKFTPLYELSSSVFDRYTRRGQASVRECTIGNRTHVCLAGFPFVRNRMDQQVHYSKWSEWTPWELITLPKNTVRPQSAAAVPSPFRTIYNEPETKLRVWMRRSNCLSYDARGRQVPHDSLLHKCFSLARFQYFLNSSVASFPIQRLKRLPQSNTSDGICTTADTNGHFLFSIKDQECWQHCKKTSTAVRYFVPRKNGIPCRPQQRDKKTIYYSGFCLAGVCISQTSPIVQQLDVVPVSEPFFNISAGNLLFELRNRARFVKSITFVTSDHVPRLASPVAIFRDHQYQCDVVCLARAFESMLRWPNQIFPHVRVTYYKTPKTNIRRLLDHCVHLSGHLIRCGTVCLITLASDNIRMISPHECAAFSIQLSFIFSNNDS